MDSQRVWLITGSSSGFGLSLCKYALSRGDKVVATLRTPSALDDLARKYPRDTLLVLKLDVTRPDEIADAFAQAKAHFGRVDVVFNNAASFLVGEIEGVPDAAARQIMDVVFWGAASVSKEAVRFFREENPAGAGGLLLNVSSDAGHNWFPCIAYYIAAKHALEGFTETLLHELDPAWNIKIALVTPGVFRTDIKAKAAVLPVHAAYAGVESTQHARTTIDALWDPARPLRVGNVDKAVQRIYEFSRLERPHFRLFLGEDCRKRVVQQTWRVTADLDASAPWLEDLLEDEVAREVLSSS